jgi:hypothetical protein
MSFHRVGNGAIFSSIVGRVAARFSGCTPAPTAGAVPRPTINKKLLFSWKLVVSIRLRKNRSGYSTTGTILGDFP